MKGERYLSFLATLSDDLKKVGESDQTAVVLTELIEANNAKLWSGLTPMLEDLVSESETTSGYHDRADGAEVLLKLASGLDLINTWLKEGVELDAVRSKLDEVKLTLKDNYEKIMSKLLTRAAEEYGQPMCIGIGKWVADEPEPLSKTPLLSAPCKMSVCHLKMEVSPGKKNV